MIIPNGFAWFIPFGEPPFLHSTIGDKFEVLVHKFDNDRLCRFESHPSASLDESVEIVVFERRYMLGHVLYLQRPKCLKVKA